VPAPHRTHGGCPEGAAPSGSIRGALEGVFRVDPDAIDHGKGFGQDPRHTSSGTRKAMNELKSQRSLTGDDDLALTLMTMWALWARRPIPGGPVLLLTEQQLIDFWAE
jgi:hypothetical protein